jgi:hypothetical protein
MLDWRGKTNEEALAAWNNDESVWSVECGGLGPGYEQCIQLMAFEMLRAMVENPPEDWTAFEAESDDATKLWKAYHDKIGSDPKVEHVVKTLRVSGAQFGAAMQIAIIFARHGYSQGLEKAPKDRLIQVARTFPTLE